MADYFKDLYTNALANNKGIGKLISYTFPISSPSTDVPPKPMSFEKKEYNKEISDYLKSKIPTKFKKGDTVYFIADNKFKEATVDKVEINLSTNHDTVSFYILYNVSKDGASYRGLCQSRLAQSIQELYNNQKKDEEDKLVDLSKFFNS